MRRSLAPGNVLEHNGTDAIRNAIIYDAGTVTPVGYTALYYQNDQNRPTLARTFRPVTGRNAAAQTFTVVVNHFRSKGSPVRSRQRRSIPGQLQWHARLDGRQRRRLARDESHR